MSHYFLNLLRGLVCLTLIVGAHAAPFVAPTDANPPFRRDLLPIDTDSMVTLSRDLAVLSHGIPLETATERRAVAQSLALALALDPANTSARDTISELVEGKIPNHAKFAKLIKAKARIWQIHAWLNTPQAGTDGNLLGEMIGDAASILDPENPAAVELRSTPEKAQWQDWVAPLSAFEEKLVAKNDTEKTDIDPFEGVKPDIPAPDKPATNSPAITLMAGRLTSVLYVYDELAKSWELRPTSIEMKAKTDGDGSFKIEVVGTPGEQQQIQKRVARPIREALAKLHSELPKNGLISITTNSGREYSIGRNGSKMTGPAFILANSAFVGTETDATVLLSLDDKGKIIAPNFFWRQVNALNKGAGGRLVVPAGTEEYFVAMLTLEDPMFFLKYEVLVASSPEEFMEFCAKTPSEGNATAFANFQEIKTKADENALGSYLSNRYVRQRLQEIVDTAPYHLSAKLLEKQGAGERPRTLTKKLLASEIWRAITPISDLVKQDLRVANDANVSKIEDIYDTMRDDLDRLDRYAGMRDRDLVSQGKDAAITVRTLARALRSRSDDFGERFNEINAAQVAMVKTRETLLIKLSELSGDPFVGKQKN